MTAAVHVIKPGLLTTIQDRGRWGHQAAGVPVSGPMDPFSHRVANALVGNGADAATLEVTLLGPELEFEDERLVAVSGARFDVWVDSDRVPSETSVVVQRGSRLRFGRRAGGARAYVGISGGITVPEVFGSRATHVLTKMGGLNGRPVAAGDRIPLGGHGNEVPGDRRSARAGHRIGSSRDRERPEEVRVLAGPNQEFFAGDAFDILQAGPFLVTPDSDRMAYRLDGPSLARVRGGDIISDATPMGTLQVPPSGRPILLMADRQTTGGYPKIATVITADIPKVGQLAPGDSVSFRLCSTRDALAALISQERVLMALEGRS